MMDDGKKVDVLLTALAERYSVLRVIRERVQNVALTAIGLMLGASGWLIQSDAVFSCKEKVAAVAGILAATAILRFMYLADLKAGFQSQQRVAAKLEEALGLFEPGALSSQTAPMYPPEWALAGTEVGSGGFFRTMHTMIYVGAIFLIVATVFAA